MLLPAVGVSLGVLLAQVLGYEHEGLRRQPAASCRVCGCMF